MSQERPWRRDLAADGEQVSGIYQHRPTEHLFTVQTWTVANWLLNYLLLFGSDEFVRSGVFIWTFHTSIARVLNSWLKLCEKGVKNIHWENLRKIIFKVDKGASLLSPPPPTTPQTFIHGNLYLVTHLMKSHNNFAPERLSRSQMLCRRNTNVFISFEIIEKYRFLYKKLLFTWAGVWGATPPPPLLYSSSFHSRLQNVRKLDLATDGWNFQMSTMCTFYDKLSWFFLFFTTFLKYCNTIP